jgi:hypothetical protein
VAYQDVGSAILGGFNAARASKQQKFSNDLLTKEANRLEAELQLRQDAAAQKGVIANNDQYIQNLAASNLLSKDMLSLDKQKLADGISKGDAATTGVMLDLANRSGLLPNGSVAESIVPLPNGGYAVTLRTFEGALAPITKNATSAGDDNVVKFSPGQLANLGNQYYKGTVVSNSSLISPAMFRATANMVETEDDALNLNNRYANILQSSNIIDGVASTGDLQLGRDAMNAVAEVDETDEESTIKSDISDSLQIPNILTDVAKLAPDAGSGLSQDDPRAKVDERSGLTGGMYGSMSNAGIQAQTKLNDRLIDPDSGASLNDVIAELDGKRDDLVKQLKDGEITTFKFDREMKKLDTARKVNVKKANQASSRKIKNLTSRRNALIKRNLMSEAQDIQNQLDAEIGSSYTAEGLKRLSLQLETESKKEIDEKIENGEIQLNQEDVKEITTKMQDQEVRELNDLTRLNTKDRALARAVILSMTTDETSRRALREEIDNIYETGRASMSAKDAATNRINTDKNKIALRKINNESRQWAEGQYENLNDDLETFYTGMNKVYFGENFQDENLDRRTAKGVIRQFLPTLLSRIENTTSPQAQDQWSKAFGSLISTTVGALAEDGDTGLGEAFFAWFRPNARNSIQSTDFDISKVRPVYSAKGKVTGYVYTDQYGRQTDSEISVGQVKSLDENLAKALRAVVTKRHPFTDAK